MKERPTTAGSTCRPSRLRASRFRVSHRCPVDPRTESKRRRIPPPGDSRGAASTDAQRVIEHVARFLYGLPWAVITITPIVAIFPLALIHEIGHAVVALGRVPGPVIVKVGRDRSMTTFGLGRMTFRLDPIIRPGEFDAICTVELRNPADKIFVALGGPLASLVVGLLAATAAYATHTSTTVQAVLVVVACLSLLEAVVNLLPRTRTNSAGLSLRSDGGRVVDALRERRQQQIFRVPQRQWFMPTISPPDDTLGAASTDLATETEAEGTWALRPPRRAN
jgi:hypothetical protein